jgi:hypothetical protein
VNHSEKYLLSNQKVRMNRMNLISALPCRCKHAAHDGYGFFLNPSQMPLTQEALRIDLVNVFRARRTGGKPSVRGNDFESPDVGIIAGRTG